MEKDKLPPIPTPASQRWREFRIQFLPIVVFAMILLGIVYLWRGYVQPIGVIGFADTNVVNVTTLQDGMISELLVERFQYVKAGQPIAVVMNTDPVLVQAQIESAQADIKMMQARTKVDIDRTAQAFQEFKQDYFKQRIGSMPPTSSSGLRPSSNKAAVRWRMSIPPAPNAMPMRQPSKNAVSRSRSLGSHSPPWKRIASPRPPTPSIPSWKAWKRKPRNWS